METLNDCIFILEVLRDQIRKACQSHDDNATLGIFKMEFRKAVWEIGKSIKSKAVFAVLIHTYFTVTFLNNVAFNDDFKFKVDMGLHFLACFISLCFGPQTLGQRTRGMILSIASYPKPVRLLLKYIEGRNAMDVIQQERTDHMNVITEPALEAIEKFYDFDLKFKRVELIVAIVRTLPMEILNLYLLQTAQPISVSLMLPIAVSLITCFVHGYDYYKTDSAWIAEARNSLMRGMELV